jgi:hypothetical protein
MFEVKVWCLVEFCVMIKNPYLYTTLLEIEESLLMSKKQKQFRRTAKKGRRTDQGTMKKVQEDHDERTEGTTMKKV